MTGAAIPSPYDDGLYLHEARAWAEDKHRLVELYEALFSTGMKFKWDVRVCIDLFAGPGLLRVRETNRLLWGSPIRSLAVKDPFDKYIFCDEDGEALDALRQRVARMFPSIDVSFIQGDCNDNVEQIKELIPAGSKSRKVLSFCFVDPYDLSVRFSAIKSLSHRYMDFLVLLALNMDANRNLQSYLNPANRKLDEFLGLSDWRERWERRSPTTMTFPQFLAELYAARMETLGYLPLQFHRMKQIRSDAKNLPLYHLALFSRSSLAYDYWDEVLKYSSSQTSFEGW